MGIFKNFKENWNAKSATAEAPKFDTKKMSDPKFIEFMADVYEDVKDLDPETNSDVLEQRYKAFQEKGKIISGLDRIYSKQLDGLVGVDSKERKEQIEGFVNEQIKEDPEALNGLLEKIAAFEESEKELEAKKKILSRFDKHGGVEGIKSKNEILQKAAEFTGGINTVIGMFKKGRQEALDNLTIGLNIPLEKFDEEMRKHTELVVNSQNAEKMVNDVKEKFRDVREFILKDLEVVKGLAEMAREALKNSVDSVVTDIDSKAPNELNEFFKQFKNLGEDYAKGSMVFEHPEAAGDYESAMETLQKEMLERMEKEVAKIVVHVGLGDLEKNLAPYLKGQELGTMSAGESKDKVREELEKVLEDTTAPIDDNKKFLLKVLLAKYE